MNTNQRNVSRKPRKNTSRLPAAAVVILVLILALVIGAVIGVVYLLKWYKPDVGVDPNLLPNGVGETDKNGEIDLSTVRKDDFFTFLLLGKDVGGYNTDVFMLVSFDVANHKISIMQIPRDTYVESDGNSYKINALYAHMRNKARKESTESMKEEELIEAGMTGVVKTLSVNLNMNIDYYVILDLQGFRNIVDAIGGVYMYVPRDMDYDDPEQDLHIHLKQGSQLLDGEKSEQFVRFRKGYKLGDISRVEAQKLFMSALAEAVKTNLSVTTVANIAEQAFTYVNTSMDAAELVYFAKEFFSVESSGITMLTCPGDAAYVDRVSYYVVHRADLLYTVNQYFNVFRADVTDAQFDTALAFTSETDEEVMKIYQKDFSGGDDFSSTMDEIEKDGIPLV